MIKNSSGAQAKSDTNTTENPREWMTTVDAADTYTITATATDGSGKTKSTTVSITAVGQAETVTLTYDLILFDGTDHTAVTGGLKLQVGNGGSANVTNAPISDGKISFYRGEAFVGIYPVNKIDITEYSTLYVDLYCGANLQYVSCAGILYPNVTPTTAMDTGASGAAQFVARQDFVKGTNSLAIPVDSLSGELQFMIMYYAPNGGDFSISNIRFA